MNLKVKIDKVRISREIKTYNIFGWFCLIVSALFFAGVIFFDIISGVHFSGVLSMLMALFGIALAATCFLLFHMRDSLKNKIELQDLLLEIQKSLEEKKDK